MTLTPVQEQGIFGQTAELAQKLFDNRETGGFKPAFKTVSDVLIRLNNATKETGYPISEIMVGFDEIHLGVSEDFIAYLTHSESAGFAALEKARLPYFGHEGPINNSEKGHLKILY